MTSGFKNWFNIEELMPWVRGRLRNLVSNPSDAEEIEGEIYLIIAKVLQSQSPAPKDAKTIYGWLNTVVRNAVSDYFKKRQPMLVPDDSPALADVPAEPEVNPMELDYVKRAVAKLPEHLREVIILYYYQDKKFGEIAAELGINPSTAKRRAFEGRQMLKKMLRKYQ